MSHFLIRGASELLEDGSGKIHDEFGLTRGGVAFFKDELFRCANRVEVLFGTSKSGHKGAEAVSNTSASTLCFVGNGRG